MMQRTTDTIAAMATPAGPGGHRHPASVRAARPSRSLRRLPARGRAGRWRPIRPRAPGLRRPAGPGGGSPSTRCCAPSAGARPATPGRTRRSSTATAPPWCSPWGWRPCSPRGPDRPGRGSSPAGPFLTARLDLAQAEAVGDLLEARSREGARHAAGQLSGALSRRIGGIYSALVDVMAHFHAVLDYPDEDIDPFRMEELSRSWLSQQEARSGPCWPPIAGAQLYPGRGALRHRGPPQRGQVLPAQRPGGL